MVALGRWPRWWMPRDLRRGREEGGFGGEGRDGAGEKGPLGSVRWGRLARLKHGWERKGWSLGRSVGMTLDSYCCCY